MVKSLTTVSFESNLRAQSFRTDFVRKEGDHLDVDGVRMGLVCVTERDPLRGRGRSGEGHTTR